MSPSNHHPIKYYNTNIYIKVKNMIIVKYFNYLQKMLDICLDLLYNYKLHN